MLGAVLRNVRPVAMRVCRTLAMSAEQKEDINSRIKADKIVVSTTFLYRIYILYTYIYIYTSSCIS